VRTITVARTDPISSATALTVSVALAVGAGGCGSSKRTAPDAGGPSGASSGACSASASRATSEFVGGRAISATAYLPPDGSQGCALRAAGRRSATITVDLHVDTLPRPLARLEREAVETTQNVLWSHSRAVPRPVANLGQASWWIPADSRLLASDGQRLVSVAVTWPGSRPTRRLALAEALARSYLGP
jgi:hypothetical protein